MTVYQHRRLIEKRLLLSWEDSLRPKISSKQLTQHTFRCQYFLPVSPENFPKKLTFSVSTSDMRTFVLGLPLLQILHRFSSEWMKEIYNTSGTLLVHHRRRYPNLVSLILIQIYYLLPQNIFFQSCCRFTLVKDRIPEVVGKECSSLFQVLVTKYNWFSKSTTLICW
jgi:hypothetical protein